MCGAVQSREEGKKSAVSKSAGQWGECCSAGADIESRRGKAVSRTTWKYHIQSLQGGRELCGEAVLEQDSSQENRRRKSQIKDTRQCFQKT